MISQYLIIRAMLRKHRGVDLPPLDPTELEWTPFGKMIVIMVLLISSLISAVWYLL